MIKLIVKDIGEPFDGLVVYTDDDNASILLRKNIPVPILRIESKRALFETFSLPIESGLFINSDNLFRYQDVVTEQMTDNPFGKFKYHGKATNGLLDVSWTAYSDAFTVTLKREEQTIYTHNFMTRERAAIVAYFIAQISSTDWDNLVFDLQDLETKEIEITGNDDEEKERQS